MNKIYNTRIFSAAVLAIVLFAGAVSTGAKASVSVPKQAWSFNGVFGSFDRAALRRGFQVYAEVCVSCHGLGLVAYRNLMDIGFTEDEVKAIAAEFEVQAGPDAEGEMFMRPALPADRFVAPYPNDNAARAGNNGALPPDLSLMAKARLGGADYLYALLTGYHEEAPEGHEVTEGMSYNDYFPGNQIAMAPPLADETVEYADGTPATLTQHASDIATFLTWTASPELEQRKSMGVKVILFLIVWTGMLYAWKVRIWKKLH
mgnify:CR=1 FL=1